MLTKDLWRRGNYVFGLSCKLKLSIPIGLEPANGISIEPNKIVLENYLAKGYAKRDLRIDIKL